MRKYFRCAFFFLVFLSGSLSLYGAESDKDLSEFRAQLDQINREIVVKISQRLQITKELAKYKREKGIPIYDPAREELQIKRARELAVEYGLDPNVVEDIFRIIIPYCRNTMTKQ